MLNTPSQANPMIGSDCSLLLMCPTNVIIFGLGYAILAIFVCLDHLYFGAVLPDEFLLMFTKHAYNHLIAQEEEGCRKCRDTTCKSNILNSVKRVNL